MSVYVQLLILLGTVVLSVLAGFWGAGIRVGETIEKLKNLEKNIADLQEESGNMRQMLGDLGGQLKRINGGKYG